MDAICPQKWIENMFLKIGWFCGTKAGYDVEALVEPCNLGRSDHVMLYFLMLTENKAEHIQTHVVEFKNIYSNEFRTMITRIAL